MTNRFVPQQYVYTTTTANTTGSYWSGGTNAAGWLTTNAAGWLTFTPTGATWQPFEEDSPEPEEPEVCDRYRGRKRDHCTTCGHLYAEHPEKALADLLDLQTRLGQD